MERRDVLKGMVLGAGSLAAASASGVLTGCAPGAVPVAYPTTPAPAGAPNILVVMIDQMRFPRHFPAGISTAEEFVAAYMPNLHSLWTTGVPFSGHHTAAQACTPARSTILTGLHARRTWMMNTRLLDNDLTLQPEWPTYGKLLRNSGYRTQWIGKWHLSQVPNTSALDQYGFDTYVAPDPVGRPDGQVVDPLIADAAISFLQSQTGGGDPFCATVSFINPHDKQFFWALLDIQLLQSKGGATCLFNRLGIQGQGVRSNYTDAALPTFGYPAVPDNWESAAQLLANKPYTQWATRETFDGIFGTAISDDPLEAEFRKVDSPLLANDKVAAPYSWWARGMDMYTQAMADVDVQIGRVMAAIPPAVRDNTVVVFVSDHGEYGGSHGMSGKTGSFYDEAVRVPMVVVDPRPGRMAATGVLRDQLTSSVDFLPLLMDIAHDGGPWRTGILGDLYADTTDLRAMVTNPAAPGRPYILSTCDEYLRTANAEWFMVGVRDRDTKAVAYWPTLDTSAPPTVEFYDLTTPQGVLELDNQPGDPRAAAWVERLQQEIIPRDIGRALPSSLSQVQTNAVSAYQFNRSVWDGLSSVIVNLVC